MILLMVSSILFCCVYLVSSDIKDLFISNFILLAAYTIHLYYHPLKKLNVLKKIKRRI